MNKVLIWILIAVSWFAIFFILNLIAKLSISNPYYQGFVVGVVGWKLCDFTEEYIKEKLNYESN